MEQNNEGKKKGFIKRVGLTLVYNHASEFNGKLQAPINYAHYRHSILYIRHSIYDILGT